ncbi:unnamed protein product [Calypogeia fissa]
MIAKTSRLGNKKPDGNRNWVGCLWTIPKSQPTGNAEKIKNPDLLDQSGSDSAAEEKCAKAEEGAEFDAEIEVSVGVEFLRGRLASPVLGLVAAGGRSSHRVRQRISEIVDGRGACWTAEELAGSRIDFSRIFSITASRETSAGSSSSGYHLIFVRGAPSYIIIFVAKELPGRGSLLCLLKRTIADRPVYIVYMITGYS